MAKNDLNDINEGLRRLQEYEATLKRIEALAKSIAATLNSAGGDRSGLMGSLQQLQAMRIDAQTGAITGGSSGSGLIGGGSSGGGGAGGGEGAVSPGLLDALERSRRGGLAGYAGMYALHQAPAFMDANAQAIISGRRDPMQDARNTGSLIGGLIGGGLGFVFGGGPIGAGIGAGIGSSLLGSAFNWAFAPEAARQNASLAMSPFLGAYGGRGGGGWRDYYLNPGPQPWYMIPGMPASVDQTRIAGLTNFINRQGLPNELQMSMGDVGATFGSVASGLFAGGLNPMQVVGNFRGVTRPYAGYASRFQGGNGGLIDTLINVGGTALSNMPRVYSSPNETLAEQYTRRLGTLFGNAAPDVAKQLNPLFGTLPETGGNIADILTRFGPEATSTYLRIQSDSLTSSVDPMRLSRSSAGFRSGQRRAALGALSARGAASAALEGVGDELDALGSLPGGTGSLAYAQARAQARSLGRAAFDTEQITEFDIPHTRLMGEMTRAELMPFGSSNRLGLQFRNIGMMRQRIGALEGFMSRRRATGNLSEAEELDLTSQIEGARNSIAGSIAVLGQGRENILPALTAGATRFSGRFTSASMAALALWRMGSPIRSYGAVHGGHLSEQDAAWADMGGAGFERPHSRTAALNNGRDSKEIVAAIKEQTEVLKQLLGIRSSGGSVRPGEAAGRAQGSLSRQNLNTGDLYSVN